MGGYYGTYRLRAPVGWSDRQLNRNWAACSRTTAAVTRRAARAGAVPTANVPVGPAGAQAGDPTRAVAARAPGEWSGHGLIHDRFKDGCAGQDAEPGGELRENDGTHVENPREKRGN